MMKKKLLAAVAALLAAVLLCLPLAACDDTVETIVGKWESPDGYTLVLTEDTLALTNDKHENALPSEELPYRWSGDVLMVVIDGQTFPVFTTYLSEDTLKLTYVPALDDGEKPVSITLTRVKESSGLLSSCS